MLVRLRNPSREVQVPGPASLTKILGQLDIHRETVIVIRNGTLVPADAMLDDADVIEIRPVISGGT